MKKYWMFFMQIVHGFFAYRLKILLIILSHFIFPLTMIWIFSGVSGSKFIGMSQSQIVSYYLFTSIMTLFLKSRADSFISSSVEEGMFASFLIKPIHYASTVFIRDFSYRLLSFIVGLPFFLILVLFYGGISLSFSINSILITLLIVIVSFLLAFEIAFIFGLLVFWIEEIWGLQNLKDVSILILSGVVLPYQFFPKDLQHLLSWSPFPYLINWPLRKGFTGNLPFEFIIAVLWINIFLIINIILWKKGLKKYSGWGAY